MLCIPAISSLRLLGQHMRSLGRSANTPRGFENRTKLSPDPMSTFNVRKSDCSRSRMGLLLKLKLKLKCVL